VDGGITHACAIDMGGVVYCWGATSDGQLGDPGNDGTSRQPVTLASLATDLTVGDRHVCALLDDSSIQCWGRNTEGQVELGGPASHLVPFAVTLPGGELASAVRAGTAHTCAVGTGGGVYCWGRNTFGQLGDGTTTTPTSIVSVSAP
jgi:alpha-tubulin suppressor-like RCC1 family protein